MGLWLRLVLLGFSFLVPVLDATAPVYAGWWCLHLSYLFFLSLALSSWHRFAMICFFVLWLTGWIGGKLVEIAIWALGILVLRVVIYLMPGFSAAAYLVISLLLFGVMFAIHGKSGFLLNLLLTILCVSFFYGLSLLAVWTKKIAIERV